MEEQSMLKEYEAKMTARIEEENEHKELFRNINLGNGNAGLCFDRGKDGKLNLFCIREGQRVPQRVRIRKLTPRECGRLMGLEEPEIDRIESSGVSRSAQYKLYGNSIVVQPMMHIFRKLFCQPENESPQLSLF